MKDANEQSDEEVHRGKPGRVPIARASVPMQLKYATLPHVDVFANAEAAWSPSLRDVYGSFTLWAWLWPQVINSISPPKKLGDGAEIFKIWSSCWPAPLLKLSSGPPRVTSLEQKMLLSPLSLRKYQGFQKFLTRNTETKTDYLPHYTTQRDHQGNLRGDADEEGRKLGERNDLKPSEKRVSRKSGCVKNCC